MKRLLIALLMLAALSGCSEAPVFHEDQYLLREMAETIHEGSTEVSAEVPFDYAASLERSGTLKAVPEQIGVLIQWRDSSQANTYQIYLRMDGEDLISEDEMRV